MKDFKFEINFNDGLTFARIGTNFKQSRFLATVLDADLEPTGEVIDVDTKNSVEHGYNENKYVRGYVKTVTPRDASKKQFKVFTIKKTFPYFADMDIEGDQVTLRIPGFVSKTYPLEALFHNYTHNRRTIPHESLDFFYFKSQDYSTLSTFVEKMLSQIDLWRKIKPEIKKVTYKEDEYILAAAQGSINPFGLDVYRDAAHRFLFSGTKNEVIAFCKKHSIDISHLDF